MTARLLIEEDQRGNANPRALISRAPRLTLTQAFGIIAHDLPADATVIVNTQGNLRYDVFPFNGPADAMNANLPELTHLRYELRPDLHTAIIHRIKVDGERGLGTRKGIGTALIASQLPFWEQMGVQSLVVQTHDMSEGFYEKLGFQRTGPLAEFRNNAGILTNMRLDLTDLMQNARFQSAIQRHPATVLKNG